MMFNNFSSFGNLGLTLVVGKLFGLAFLVGLIFVIAWAIKNFKKDQLFNWGVTLLIIGVLGWLLFAPYGRYGMGGGFGFGMMGPGMMGSEMLDCMQDEECEEEMEEFMERMMDFNNDR